MRATMLLSATSNGVGVNVRLIWEWMDRLCKGLSIPRNQGIYTLSFLILSIPMLSQLRIAGATGS
jgi:hypothetical protein